MPHAILPLRPAFALFLLLVGAGALHAHPNGTSKVYVRLLAGDSITVEVDANTDDMLNAVRHRMDPAVFAPEEARIYQEKAASYVLSRVKVLVDGQSLRNPRIVSWKRNGRGIEDDLAGDSAAFWDTTHAITFGGKLPAAGKSLGIAVALFPEFGVQTISEVSVLWRDTLIERKWLTLDRVMRLPLSADSLAGRLARVRAAPESAAGSGLFGRFTLLGFTHILPHGVDHILFVLGLFFFSTRMRPLLFQVTAFTVAHSITLALALLGIFSLPPQIVEPLIALSIAVVGIENVFFRGVRTSRWLLVFGFGLIHGMGFAGVLSDLGLPEGGFWPALIGFNLGVEFGQMAVIGAALCLTFWARKKAWYFKRVVVPVSLAISAVGLYWAIERFLAP